MPTSVLSGSTPIKSASLPISSQLFLLLDSLGRLRQASQHLSSPVIQTFFLEQSQHLFKQLRADDYLQAYFQKSHSTDERVSERIFTYWQQFKQLEAQWNTLSTQRHCDYEQELFLSQVAPLSLLTGIDERRILITAQPALVGLTIPKLLCEQLSGLQQGNLLAWPGLLSRFVMQLFKQQVALWVESPVSHAFQGASLSWNATIPHILALRLLGPGYYYYFVNHHLCERALDPLSQLEPLLFFALNYFNYNDSRLVRLHEEVERNNSVLNRQETAPSQDNYRNLLEVVEHAIPQRLCYQHLSTSERSALEKRLKEGRLASSLPTCQWQNSDQKIESSSFYETISTFNERPLSARQLLLAGWTRWFESAPGYSMQLLNTALSNEQALAQLDILGQSLTQEDRLLLKSIETAEVHRSLLGSMQ